MSEKNPGDKRKIPGFDEIRKGIYQSTALEFYYQCLAKTSPEQSVVPPAENAQIRRIELEPFFDETTEDYDRDEPDETPDWENITVFVFPEYYIDEESNELLAQVVLSQFIDEEYMEYITDYKLIFEKTRYRVVRTHYIYDGANTSEPWYVFDDISIAGIEEIDELRNLISSALPTGE